MSQPMDLSDLGACPEGHDLDLHVDGELMETDRASVEAHLGRCLVCRGRVAEKLAFKRRLLRTNEAVSATDALRARLRLKLDAEPVPDAGPVAPPVARARFRWARPAPLAAGATVMGLAAWFVLGQTTDDLARDLVARHARPQPLELQSDDPGVVEGWFSGKSDFPVHVPLPGSPRFALLGARLSHVRDRPAAYLQYGDRQSPMHRISVIVFDDPSGRVPFGAARRIRDREVFFARASGYNVVQWRRNEIVYSVVADGDEEGLDFVQAAEHRGPPIHCRTSESIRPGWSSWESIAALVGMHRPAMDGFDCIE
jgi:anti-sigma factor RsiW